MRRVQRVVPGDRWRLTGKNRWAYTVCYGTKVCYYGDEESGGVKASDGPGGMVRVVSGMFFFFFPCGRRGGSTGAGTVKGLLTDCDSRGIYG